MHPKELKEVLTRIINTKQRVPIIIKGDAGIGKSWIVKQVAEDLKMKIVDLRLAQCEPGDLIGLPRTDPETKKTIWLAPEWFPKASDVPNGMILFLDELNRAPIDVRQAIFQLLTEYKMHTHTLPDNVYLVSAINPDDGKSSYQVEQFDPAMVNRMCFLNLETDVDQWVAWAHENKVHDLVIRFISVNNNLLHSMSETGPFPSPRTWHLLSNLLNADAIPPSSQSEVISGLVGDKPAIAFIRFMDKEYQKPISGREVLENFDKVKNKLQKQRNDETYATITDLVGLIGEGAKLDKKQFGNLIQFSIALKQEEQMAFFKKLPCPLLSKLGTASPDLCNAVAKIASEMELERNKKK